MSAAGVDWVLYVTFTYFCICVCFFHQLPRDTLTVILCVLSLRCVTQTTNYTRQEDSGEHLPLSRHPQDMSGGGVCPFRLSWRLVYYAGLTAVLLGVACGQGVLLDSYILANNTSSLTYFWLLPDFLMVFPFVAAMVSGYRRGQAGKRGPSTSPPQLEPQLVPPVHVQLLGPCAEPVLVWLAYSALLMAKVVVIFRSEIPNKIGMEDFLSPQLLKVTLSATALVFGLLVEGQSTWGTVSQEEEDREAYIRGLVHGTALETLDSVAFLTLLVQSESQLVLPLTLERLILALACINLLLPALALVRLSQADYGRGKLAGHLLPLLYKLAHLWLTNVSFMVVRVYLWAGLSASVSPFLVKNIYHIFAVMREVWLEAKALIEGGGGACCHGWCPLRRRRHRVYGAKHAATALNDSGGGGDGSEWRRDSAAEDKFEEIDLKQSDVRS